MASRPTSVQMPLNVMDAHYNSFGQKVLPELVKHNIGVLGMKPMGAGFILKSGVVTPIECLHYAMNLPTSVVITGCESVANVEQAINAATTFKPMTKEQVASILAKTAPIGERRPLRGLQEHADVRWNDGESGVAQLVSRLRPHPARAPPSPEGEGKERTLI